MKVNEEAIRDNLKRIKSLFDDISDDDISFYAMKELMPLIKDVEDLMNAITYHILEGVE